MRYSEDDVPQHLAGVIGVPGSMRTCLQALGRHSGAIVGLALCGSAGAQEQQWSITSNGEIVLDQADLCMDDVGAS